MCTIPPGPPPPPPPPSLVTPNSEDTKESTNIPSTPPLFTFTDVCKWASEYPQVKEACAKNKICLQQPPFKFKYKHFESILQIGPTCGLVALAMLLEGKVPAEEILSISKAEGYSNNGEMFSCKNMLKLAEKVLKLAKINNISYEINRNLFDHKTIEKLLNGALILVPYDADFNHSPCLKQGHTAHWALICGVIVIQDPGESYTSSLSNVYVLCKHGKSRYVAAWRLDELDKSNKNLWEFSPKRGGEAWTYILPEGGVGGDDGLREQYVVFQG